MADEHCPTCGAPVGERRHLCASGPAPEKAYVCEFCGRADGDPRHVCFPKRAEMKFVCGTCGRSAAWSDALCKPRPIEGADRNRNKEEETEPGKTGKG